MQQLSTVVSDWIEVGAEFVPTVSECELRRSGLELRAMLAVACDDNLFLSRTRPESDAARLFPALRFSRELSQRTSSKKQFLSS
jgi:hypothetical protein